MDVKKAWPWFFAGWLLLAVAAAWLFWGSGGFRNLEAFPTTSYHDEPTNLRGNVYRLEGHIQAILGWAEGEGRLLAVQPADGGQRVPVFVPDTLRESMHVGQRYRMRVNIDRTGLIKVQEMGKY